MLIADFAPGFWTASQDGRGAAIGKVLGGVASMLPSPPLTPDAIDFITQPAVADNTRLLEVLRPELTPLREGLGTYLSAK